MSDNGSDRFPRRAGALRLSGETLKAVILGGAVIVLGLFVWLMPKGSSAEHHAKAKPSPTASGGDLRPAPSAKAPAGGDEPSASPHPSYSLPPVDLKQHDRVAQDFAKVFLTRSPATEKDQEPSLDRSKPWMTEELVQNLATHNDPDWDRLVANGADKAVVTAVSVAGEGASEPTDNPLRVYRKVTVHLHVTGRETYNDVRVLHEELSLVGNDWRVSALLHLYNKDGSVSGGA